MLPNLRQHAVEMQILVGLQDNKSTIRSYSYKFVASRICMNDKQKICSMKNLYE